MPSFAQAPAPATSQPAQNATPPAVPIAPPGGAPRSFADLTSRLSPAVVNVSTTQKVEVGKMRGGAPGSPLEELFRRFQEQQGDGGAPVTREATSLGSGFIIDPTGYIVTNNHVISAGEGRGAPVDTITVTLSDRREYKAKLIGRDTLTDMALLKIDAKDLPFVKFGNSQNVRVGDWAIAIGNPFGLGGTVTAGIVSALHRNIGSGQYDRYIQTDASINQGNSGGPLFDLEGNVIGINTAIFSPTGGNVGLGFSIPAELAYPVIQQLRATGTVKRGYLGVGIQPLTTDIAAGLGLPKDKGEIVASVEPMGPAARAGIRQGDVVVRINNSDVTYDNTLSYIVANTPVGTTVPIEVIREGQRKTLNATVAQRPAESVVQARAGITPDGDEDTADATKDAEAAKASLGITLQPLTAQLRQQLRIPETTRGVVIAGINPGSDAASNGLQRGDVILQINQRPTTTPAEAAAAVDAAKKAGRDTVLMLVQRGSMPPTYRGVKLNSAK
ncbi:Do family serine endopeptidase [Polymorphobacter fuscus]|uniref:Probable periplasmic serine endoprotease DegP-like n=1 Tax=Sandarakinorhabdus fusca TaxID=1439888 RepID=A0A7C9GR78_9SPHN|nr:Do family serine endopeptidase [Polymorphobacter fuscus]MQT18250.1 Do family serine endopeptidase [Polymorphobacter fuscus]